MSIENGPVPLSEPKPEPGGIKGYLRWAYNLFLRYSSSGSRGALVGMCVGAGIGMITKPEATGAFSLVGVVFGGGIGRNLGKR